MQALIDDIRDALISIDRSGVAFKTFQPGVGPYGEPQLVKLVANYLRDKRQYLGAKTCRTPDLIVPGEWALEFKIVRPFGDNGVEAEHWSQNLLHPYPGNVSAIGDALKLLAYQGPEKKGLVVVCYEHRQPKIDLSILVSAFELISRNLLSIPLGERISSAASDCVHPVHQRTTVHGWLLT